MTDSLEALREATKRFAVAVGVNQPVPRLFPPEMTEEHVRARAKAFGMYGEGQTALPWERKPQQGLW